MAKTRYISVWGYKADGSAQVFALTADELLPSGWSEDVSTIEDPKKRTAEAVSEAAGHTCRTPVRPVYEDELEEDDSGEAVEVENIAIPTKPVKPPKV